MLRGNDRYLHEANDRYLHEANWRLPDQARGTCLLDEQSGNVHTGADNRVLAQRYSTATKMVSGKCGQATM